MKIFRNPIEYPLFDRYWKMVSSVEQDKEANIDYFSFHHDEFGEIKYISSSTVSITSFGELFLIQYLPLDGHTSQVFEHLAQQAGQGVIQFCSLACKDISTLRLELLPTILPMPSNIEIKARATDFDEIRRSCRIIERYAPLKSFSRKIYFSTPKRDG